jgi:exopolysaccharide biosynthesis protein
MKTLIIVLIAFQSILTACGSIEDAINKSAQTNSSTATATSSETKTTSATATTSAVAVSTKVSTPSNTKVDVQVSVSDVSATTQKAAQADSAVYSSDLRTWADAKAKAPKGYHIGTRAELLDLIEAKKLPTNVPRNAVVWSADVEEETGKVYYVIPMNGENTPVNPLTWFPSIYVLNEAE